MITTPRQPKGAQLLPNQKLMQNCKPQTFVPWEDLLFKANKFINQPTTVELINTTGWNLDFTVINE